MSKELISKSMNINDIIVRYPESVDVFMKYGLHCFGCALASGENLEQGAKVHGMKDKEIDKMVIEANKVARKYYGSEDGGKKDIMNITLRAAKQVNKMLGNSKDFEYLRIGIIESDFGQRYSFKLENTKKKSDVLIEKVGTKFVLNKKAAALLNNSTLDYLDFMPGNGFKIYHALKSPK